MAITLGTFTKLDDGVFSGTLKTLNVTAALTIVPVDKLSDNAPDHRVYAGQRYEVGAGWSQVAKSSGETYLNLKIGAPEFRAELGPLPPGQARTPRRRRRHPHRLVGAARPVTATPRRGSPRRGFLSACDFARPIGFAGGIFSSVPEPAPSRPSSRWMRRCSPSPPAPQARSAKDG
jgi:uncharacterized protein (DUF736 family)